MTEPQFRAACDATAALIRAAGPYAADAPALRDEAAPWKPGHCLWMLGVAKGHFFDGKVEKANRWLGFVQGVMAALAIASLEQLKRANMPEGSEYDGGRI